MSPPVGRGVGRCAAAVELMEIDRPVVFEMITVHNNVWNGDRMRLEQHAVCWIVLAGYVGRLTVRRGKTCRMLTSQTQFSAILVSVVLLVAGPAVRAQTADEWPPISPEELALKDDPLNPGAPAIILYRETFSNHQESFETHHFRIKILNERGAEYGNVEIPYFKGLYRVEDIKARTVQLDGASMAFDGHIYEKTIVKARKLKGFAKTFSLPALEAGSIVEYRYKLQGERSAQFTPPWIIQGELSLRRARFSYKPYFAPLGWASLTSAAVGLPEKTEYKGGLDFGSLELQDIPPFQQEEFMPPENTARAHVRFFYAAPGFWGTVNKTAFKRTEKLIGKDRRIKRAVSETVSPGDAPIVKLRKLYARAQRIRNLSYESSGTEQESKGDAKAKDVLERGQGSGLAINRVFVALARTAGFDASIVRIARRDVTFFSRDLLDAGQLNAELVRVRLGSEDIFLDPGHAYTPFGLLSWEQTDAGGLDLGKEWGGFITTPEPVSSDARTERKATLRLTPDGTLAGEGHVAFHGQEALQHRLRAFEKGDLARREQLEEELKGWLPADSTVEIDSIKHWENPEEPLRVEFTVEAPGFASTAGRRLVVPAGILRGAREVNFQHQSRVHPVYFPHPWEEHDEILLRVPEGYQVEGVPEPRRVQTMFGEYEASWEAHAEGVLARRRLVLSKYLYPVGGYPNLRRFFSEVRAGDEQQIVLVATETDETQP